VIGLVPEAALIQTAADALRLERFDIRQVLERKIEQALLSARTLGSPDAPKPLADLKQYSVSQLLEAVAAATPVPGGAAVSALVGALSASLGVMGARLSQQRTLEPLLTEIMERLSELAQADGAAYQRFLQAARLPPSDPNRPSMLSSALHVATEIPLEIAERAIAAGTLLRACSQHVKPRTQSDLMVGFLLAIAAGKASLHTVQENLKVQSNQQLKDAVRPRVDAAAMRLEELKELCYTPPPNWWATKGNSAQASPGKAQKRNGWKSKSSTITLKKRSKLPRKNSRGKGFSGS
jgi:glutamate formiminotransferase / formiminotetrahydrofolate cyclodeaminase